ncbi:uncharacterized protein NDAI_0J03040 [Naumovozyma dairenensis CBS 421]|uniref:Sir1 ORC-binding domain-containing protein n=1 Tax=Naumovozyma dairenensis (strain ATCC 10597 / BCRC 20456 / CBS 421 / NBRC 0211 / NRRL Y-12639) TaxID=1071378 RepID=G0WHB8_NAUDC|nr:hypothetical protein NDAI_0J03040 [Naumovozyma dairenensis CBS 421]CCD27196.1 hypothetical protein NDAI_0J03040 [Naumovozyma dairenensis CBS 421]
MEKLNSRYVAIDGWLVDIDQKRIINPEDIADDLPNEDYFKLSQLHLKNWEEVSDEPQLFISTKSQLLVEKIRWRLQDFVELLDGRIVPKSTQIPTTEVLDEFSRKCHKLTLSNKISKYLFLDASIASTSRPQTNATNYNQELYPIICTPYTQHVIIEGFIIDLRNKKLCNFYSQSIRSKLPEKALRIIVEDYKANTFDMFSNINSNYLFVKDFRLFNLLEKKTYVRFKKTDDSGYSCQRTSKQSATHVCYVVQLNGQKDDIFLVREKSIDNSYTSIEMIEQPLTEMKFVTRFYNNEVEPLRYDLLSYKKSHRIDLPYTIHHITNELWTALNLPKIPDLVLNFIRDCENTEQAVLYYGLGKRLENNCLKDISERLKRITSVFEVEERLKPWNDQISNVLEIALERARINSKKVSQYIFAMYINHLFSTLLSSSKLYITLRFLLINDKFIIDLAENKLINPKSKTFLESIPEYVADALGQFDFFDWSIFNFSNEPFPIYCSELFEELHMEEREFILDDRGVLHVNNSGYSGMIVKVPCAAIELKDKSVIYIYRGLEPIELPDLEDLPVDIRPFHIVPANEIEEWYEAAIKELITLSSFSSVREIYTKYLNNLSTNTEN